MGELMSIGAALVWSFSVILFKQTGVHHPLGMNLFKNLVAIVLLGLTMWIAGIPVDRTRSGEDWGMLAFSGLMGIGLADTLFFAALARLGPGFLAVVECAYAPFVVLVSVFWLQEELAPPFYFGAVAVVIGLALATLEPADEGSRDEGRKGWWEGVFLAVFAVAAMAVGIVSVKPVLERSNLIEATQVRLVLGTLGILAWAPLSGSMMKVGQVLAPGPHWRTLLPGAFLGTYVAMILWVGGMKYTSEAAVAGVLSQTSTIFTLILSAWLLKEKMSVRKVAGAMVAMAGAAWIGLVGG